jgi:hypothetical protein
LRAPLRPRNNLNAPTRLSDDEPALKFRDPCLQRRVFSPQRPNQRDQFFPGRLAFRFANHSILESKTGSAVERNLSPIHIPVA